MTFKQALKKMPLCVGGLDFLAHTTIDDLCYLVELEMDYRDGPDGHNSTIRTPRQYEQCRKYIEAMANYRKVAV